MTNLTKQKEKIHHLTGREPAMLDYDVAELYDLTTDELNRAAEENAGRFPAPRFRFQATDEEKEELAARDERSIRGEQELWLYTEYGCNALAFVLNSSIAIDRSAQILEGFTALELEEGMKDAIRQQANTVLEYYGVPPRNAVLKS